MGTERGIFVAVFALVCVLKLHPHELGVDAEGFAYNPVVIEATPSSAQMRAEPGNNEIDSGARNITIVGDEFMLNGRPLHIISGSIHYFRVPHQYWRDRIRKAKALGFNAIATYVEWSYHEPEYRQYRFTGDYDVFEFVRIAAEEGLLVLLRPGPYICAERDLGGLPYWLLHKYPGIQLRSTDTNFIAETRTWMAKLFEHMTPLLYGNDGPIILVQVENEYGSYSNDMQYKVQLRDIIKEHVGAKALLYTTDGTYRNMIEGGAVPGALTTIDFGVDSDIRTVFNSLRQFMPTGPLMNSEFYPGWLTHWSEHLQQVPKEAVARSLEDLLNNKINVNFYVFFGGTNFEFSAGANYFAHYLPDITSYDYDAPLNEAGDPTPKYYAIREVMEKFNPSLKSINLPSVSHKGAYGIVSVTPQINLLSSEGRSLLGKKYPPVTGSALPTFEQLQQRAGLVLYETKVSRPGLHILQAENPCDRVYVYVDGELKDALSRTAKKDTAMLLAKQDSVLSLLVESQGRINYGSKLHDFKGIRGKVKWGDDILDKKWSVTGYPLENLDGLNDLDPLMNQNSTTQGPVIYKGQFTIPEGETPLDTFLDPTGWGKGFVWVNGHNLGRYWPGMGPQVTLYVPGIWLHAAPRPNTVHILELQTSSLELHVTFIDHPILNRTDANAFMVDRLSLIINV